ncbi:MAG: hypothetical protein AABX70_07740 [Nanoarchaeota archaeon]
MASLQEEMGKSVFLETFGDSPSNRILDFLIVFDKFDYSMTDLAEKAGVGYSTLKILIKELIKKGLLVQTRVSGKSKMYRFNKDGLLAQKFASFYWSITNEAVDKEKLKVIVTH